MMTRPILCLLAFAGWTILLVFCVGFTRVAQVLTGKKKSNEFPGGTQHGSDWYWRLNRAHLNAVENLPIFGAIVLTATILHIDRPQLATLAMVVVGARVVQSIAHVASGSVMVVNLRFTAFVTQMVCYVAMIVTILRVARG
jgi:uncharacterized MAPEG superfamily protein